MNFEIPKLNREEALATLRKMPFLKETPEAIVERWERFKQEIPVGTTVTNVKDTSIKGVTVDGKYYNSPGDSFVTVRIKQIFGANWLASDIVKVEEETDK